MNPKIFYTQIIFSSQIYKNVDDKKFKYILILNKHKYYEVKKNQPKGPYKYLVGPDYTTWPARFKT